MADKKPGFLGPLVVVSLIILSVVGFFAAKQHFGTAPVASQGGVPIGGAFTLTDGSGKTVTDQDFLGTNTMIYFGYTYCPDVCPTSLSLMAQALDLLAEKSPGKAARIQPIFISVDPERDTPALLKEYVKHFHPRLIGLTGTPDQVATAAKAYRVFYSKVVEKGAKPDAYLMDHSSITYVMGPDGKFVTHFGHGSDPEVMAKKLATLR